MKTWFIALINKNKCTCWFDSFKKWSWSECCGMHDLLYVSRKDHKLTKLEIDYELYKCVSKKTCKLWGAIMYIGNFIFSWIGWRMYK